MMRWLEQRMVDYLNRHGYVVLRQPFVGFVVGGNAVVHDHGTHYEAFWPIDTTHIRPIMLSGSQLIRQDSLAL